MTKSIGTKIALAISIFFMAFMMVIPNTISVSFAQDSDTPPTFDEFVDGACFNGICHNPYTGVNYEAGEEATAYQAYLRSWVSEQSGEMRGVIPPNFGTGLQDPALNGLLGGVDSSQDGNALTNLETIISRIIGSLTVLASIFFIVYFVLGAFTWVTAGGDASKIQKSRDQMVQGVMGMIVIVISYAVVGMIGTVLGVDILNPAAELGRIFGV